MNIAKLMIIYIFFVLFEGCGFCYDSQCCFPRSNSTIRKEASEAPSPMAVDKTTIEMGSQSLADQSWGEVAAAIPCPPPIKNINEGNFVEVSKLAMELQTINGGVMPEYADLLRYIQEHTSLSLSDVEEILEGLGLVS